MRMGGSGGEGRRKNEERGIICGDVEVEIKSVLCVSFIARLFVYTQTFSN